MQKSVYQHTLSAPVTLTGVGVHSGVSVTLTLKPAPAGHGIAFIRTDITDRDNIIPASWDHVADTRLCTVLANKAGATVSTVEHLMAAAAACGIDNMIVETDSAEMPILDGSALPFIRAFETAGIAQQSAHRFVLVVKKTVSVRDGDKEVFLSPADGQFFSFELVYDSPVIGRQKLSYALREDSFRREIAPARTFGFLHEVEALKKMGLARGGSLENAIVVNGDQVLNPEGLRFPNEFVRHKVLDAVGDLYLAGAQLIGHYHGLRGGHAMNNKILHALFADAEAYEFVELNRPYRPASVDVPPAGVPAWAQPLAV